MAGWVEYLLLRSALGHRVGPTGLGAAFQARLWASAVAAALAAWAFGRLAWAPLVAGGGALAHPIAVAVVLAGIYGVVYFAAAVALGVPEARRTLGRFLPV